MRRTALTTVAAVALATAGVAVGRTTAPGDGAPGEGSADVGFARDMATHHAQAVEMAEIERSRTADPGLRTLAADIALTQQAQIGRMQGWLAVWRRPLTSASAPMSWMGHAGMSGAAPMPGMATRSDVAALATLPVAEADRTFLRLMIAHHRGGADMARSGNERAKRPEVRALARQILASQEAEVRTLLAIQRSLGA